MTEYDEDWPIEVLLDPKNMDLMQERLEYMIAHDAPTAAVWKAVSNVPNTSREQAMHLMFIFLFTGEEAYTSMRRKLHGGMELEEGIDAYIRDYEMNQEKVQRDIFKDQYLTQPMAFEIHPPICHGKTMDIHKDTGEPLYFQCAECNGSIYADHRHLTQTTKETT